MGEAFQLRDDILGVFGDPGATGKPAGEDIREGKQTLLLVLARQMAGPAEQRVIETVPGNPAATDADIADVRTALTGCGALDRSNGGSPAWRGRPGPRWRPRPAFRPMPGRPAPALRPGHPPGPGPLR